MNGVGWNAVYEVPIKWKTINCYGQFSVNLCRLFDDFYKNSQWNTQYALYTPHHILHSHKK